MRFFHRHSDEDPAAQEGIDSEREQEQALAALQSGGIPPRAQRRLAELREGGDRFFTSDLSVNELALADQSGVRPLTQVMGSSIYRVGWQLTGMQWGTRAQTQELDVVAGAWNEARRRALSRLGQEAQAAGAHAVVAVRLEQGIHDWAEHAIEFIAVGTAVALEGEPAPATPVVTDLSGQDFWKLRQAGYDPVGVAAATSAWYIVPSWGSQRRMGTGGMFGGWRNVEIPEFTQAIYTARQQALGQLHAQARELGAQGVVGVSLDQSVEPHEVGSESSKRIDLRVTMHVLGTAIVAREPRPLDIRRTLEMRPVGKPAMTQEIS